MFAAIVAAPTAHSTAIRDGDARRRRRPESVLAPFWVFAIVLALLVVAAALPTASGSVRAASATHRVRIAASDTLWSVAAANPVAGLTTAESVAVIRRLNGLEDSALLQPGAVITVPSGADATADLAMR
ncbi:MAG: LysM domain-containing protein [Coriobacteriia bacterium]|nr:LysM domain-containing protein [Coriobacteriia bacterium]